MELEELKEIWNAQNKEELYTINMNRMNDLIQRKKESAVHLINISELLLITVNLGAGVFIILLNKLKPPSGIFMYLLGVWMLGAALYALYFRIRRTRDTNRFERSVRGDLDYAISTATDQVRLSLIMRWNVVPIALLTTLGMLESDKSILFAAGTAVFFGFAFYFSGWEHNLYVNKKAELEKMRRNFLQKDQPI